MVCAFVRRDNSRAIARELMTVSRVENSIKAHKVESADLIRRHNMESSLVQC